MSQILFSLLLVLLPTQLGYHVWPNWALVLGRRVDYLSPTLYLTDVLILLIIIFWGIQHKFSFLTSHFPLKRRNFSLLILLCVFIFANIFFAANRMVALFAWIKILEFLALGFYIVKTKPKFSSVIFFLSIGVFYSSLLAIMQFVFQRSLGFWILGERTFTASTPGIARVDFSPLFLLRSYATFPHPNVLGGYLAVLLPLLVTKLHDAKKIFYLSTFVLGMIALVCTFSRSAWIIFAVSMVYVVLRKKKNMLFPVLAVALIFLFYIGRTIGFGDESVVVRQQLNTAALSMFLHSPIIGNGLGNFLVQLPDYLVSRTIYFLQPAHNIYLLLLSEAGIIGLAIFLWLVWSGVKKNLLLVPFLLLGLVDHYFLTLQQGQLLFTIFLSLSLIQ